MLNKILFVILTLALVISFPLSAFATQPIIDGSAFRTKPLVGPERVVYLDYEALYYNDEWLGAMYSVSPVYPYGDFIAGYYPVDNIYQTSSEWASLDVDDSFKKLHHDVSYSTLGRNWGQFKQNFYLDIQNRDYYYCSVDFSSIGVDRYLNDVNPDGGYGESLHYVSFLDGIASTNISFSSYWYYDGVLEPCALTYVVESPTFHFADLVEKYEEFCSINGANPYYYLDVYALFDSLQVVNVPLDSSIEFSQAREANVEDSLIHFDFDVTETVYGSAGGVDDVGELGFVGILAENVSRFFSTTLFRISGIDITFGTVFALPFVVLILFAFLRRFAGG